MGRFVGLLLIFVAAPAFADCVTLADTRVRSLCGGAAQSVAEVREKLVALPGGTPTDDEKKAAANVVAEFDRLLSPALNGCVDSLAKMAAVHRALSLAEHYKGSSNPGEQAVANAASAARQANGELAKHFLCEHAHSHPTGGLADNIADMSAFDAINGCSTYDQP